MRSLILGSLGEEADVWRFVFKTLLAYYITGWLAMRFSLSQPSTAMLTTIIVANRQSGRVLAKSFYRCIGTLAGAGAALLIVSLFPQERVLYLVLVSMDRRVCRWRHLIPQLHLLCIRAVRLYGSDRRCSGHR